MNYLTVEQVLFLHARLVDEVGGLHGIRDLGLLESAVPRPQASFGGTDLYPELFDKAAALMDSLVRNYPFLDGNKRTGVAATGLSLERNGHCLADSHPDLDTIAEWLQSRSEPVG